MCYINNHDVSLVNVISILVVHSQISNNDKTCQLLEKRFLVLCTFKMPLKKTIFHKSIWSSCLHTLPLVKRTWRSYPQCGAFPHHWSWLVSSCIVVHVATRMQKLLSKTWHPCGWGPAMWGHAIVDSMTSANRNLYPALCKCQQNKQNFF